jgi:mRNA-degrading endonuclease RelE of RelBE toxin-antitoxin system
MNKIEKLLKKLDAKTRRRIENTLVLLYQGKLENLDIKKLKGSQNTFRTRVGRYRIIFNQTDKGIRLLDVELRDDKTYKNY